MGNVWFCIPSKRPIEKAEPLLRKWKDRGYQIALWLDPEDMEQWWHLLGDLVDYAHCSVQYPGYAKAVNTLVASVLANDPACDWVVTGGDDVEPDPTSPADVIAEDCSIMFRVGGSLTFGVMQPTGDRWGADEPWAQARYPDAPAYIDRICGSPWMGREFCLRANGGKGPLCEDYSHMFVDEHLQGYAQSLGILWQRRDLTQKHNHWGRARGSKEDMPPWLEKVNTRSHWDESKAIFDRHKAENYSRCAPL